MHVSITLPQFGRRSAEDSTTDACSESRTNAGIRLTQIRVDDRDVGMPWKPSIGRNAQVSLGNSRGTRLPVEIYSPHVAQIRRISARRQMGGAPGKWPRRPFGSPTLTIP